MDGEPANGTAHKLAISKSQLPALLKRAHAAKEALGAARDAEGNQLVAALRDGQQVQHDLSVWLADARTVLEAETSDNFFFKVVNLPRWPIGRFKAWLSRNKVTVKNVEKENSWAHAIITVESEKAKRRAQGILRSTNIAGAHLACCEVGEDPSKAQAGPRAPKRPRAASTERESKDNQAQKTSHTMDPAAAGRGPPAAAQAAAPSNPVHPGPPQPAEPSPHVRTPVAEDQPDSVKLKDKMCSLWSLPYSEQLKVKMCSCWDAMMQLTLEVRQATLQSHQPPWLASILQAHPDGHACCPVDPILRAPQVTQYRNRVDFTIGFDAAGRPVTGHLMGLFREGVMDVVPPDDLPMPSAIAVAYAALMTRFLNSDSSSLPAWNKAAAHSSPASTRGFWRSLSIREGRKRTFFPPELHTPPDGDLTIAGLDVDRFRVPLTATSAAASASPAARYTLSPEATEACDRPHAAAPAPDELVVLVQVNPTAAAADKVGAELRAWAAFVRAERPADVMEPTALCYHSSELLGNGLPADAAVKPVPGWDSDKVGHSDAVCELTLTMDPNSFFQVMTSSAAIVYHVIADMARPSAEGCLLDLYCGIGPIGLSLANRCKAVIGVDNMKQNITGGRSSAAALGAHNCTFTRGAAESVIRDVLVSPEFMHASDAVAVINPPRGGVHRNLLYAILDCPKVHRVVYVCSKADSVVRDLLLLLTPARAAKRRHNAVHKGNVRASAPTRYQPFKPVRAVPVDTSPQTTLFDVVVLLER